MSNLTARGLMQVLKDAGVHKSDVLVVHSNVSRLLKLPFEGIKPMQFLLGTLLEAVPNGTVAVPTFSYRFCRGKPFDSVKTPSEVGLFSEFVRRDPRALRAHHPIFSVSAIGADAPFFCRQLSKSGFGPGSVFERLLASNAKLVHFDVTMAESCTFAHFVEQRVGVPYRYSKYFRGPTVFEGVPSTEDWEFYVRATEWWEFFDQSWPDLRYPNELAATGRIARISWQGLSIEVASCEDVLDVITKGLRADPYYLYTTRPCRKNATRDG